eukprot:maker-scaffold_41-snap-gene-1.31-mRNA-1 protein AED:0.02 eAED:0.02 QI:105/1/1/1/1/1/4/214/322
MDTIYSPKVALTSSQVFEKFVFRDENECLMEQRILSPECYEFWVRSRQSPLKYPRESFQRTVTAHLRGADSRQPFPEDVERALLRQIRELIKEDKQPFNICFSMDNKRKFKNIRLLKTRFMKRYGYHEKRGYSIPTNSKVKEETKTNGDYEKLLSSFLGVSLEDFRLKREIASGYDLHFFVPAIWHVVKNLERREPERALSSGLKFDQEKELGQRLCFTQVVSTETLEIVSCSDGFRNAFGEVKHLGSSLVSVVEFMRIWRLIESKSESIGFNIFVGGCLVTGEVVDLKVCVHRLSAQKVEVKYILCSGRNVQDRTEFPLLF